MPLRRADYSNTHGLNLCGVGPINFPVNIEVALHSKARRVWRTKKAKTSQKQHDDIRIDYENLSVPLLRHILEGANNKLAKYSSGKYIMQYSTMFDMVCLVVYMGEKVAAKVVYTSVEDVALSYEDAGLFIGGRPINIRIDSDYMSVTCDATKMKYACIRDVAKINWLNSKGELSAQVKILEQRLNGTIWAVTVDDKEYNIETPDDIFSPPPNNAFVMDGRFLICVNKK